MPMAFCTLQSPKQVCLVGAGPSGFVSARELLREGHSVVVLEQNHDLGGQWLYQDAGAVTATIHISVYASLRLNAPRASTGVLPSKEETPRTSPATASSSSTSKTSPGLIRFNAEVVHVVFATPTRKWIVRSRDRILDGGEFAEEIFDAVVVGTGHYSLPRLSKIKGMEEWKRKQLRC